MKIEAPAAKPSRVSPTHIAEAARLKELWAARSTLGQADFGERYNIGNQSAVGQFLNGRVPLSMKAARGFAQGLGVELADFSPRLAEEAAKTAALVQQSPESDFVMVRRAAVSFSQGHGRVVFDTSEKAPLAFRRDFLRALGVSDKHATVVEAAGHSNSPDIPDRAVLLVHTADLARSRIHAGRFYAFRHGDELFIKKLYPQKDGVLLAVSANPDKEAYPDFSIDGKGDDFEMIGRPVWMGALL